MVTAKVGGHGRFTRRKGRPWRRRSGPRRAEASGRTGRNTGYTTKQPRRAVSARPHFPPPRRPRCTSCTRRGTPAAPRAGDRLRPRCAGVEAPEFPEVARQRYKSARRPRTRVRPLRGCSRSPRTRRGAAQCTSTALRGRQRRVVEDARTPSRSGGLAWCPGGRMAARPPVHRRRPARRRRRSSARAADSPRTATSPDLEPSNTEFETRRAGQVGDERVVGREWRRSRGRRSPRPPCAPTCFEVGRACGH